jgi:sugar phosphate permease
MATGSSLPAARQPSSRLRWLQWTAAVFCALAVAINYLDRATISIANLQIRQDFGLTATEIGGLLSIWSLCYALSQLPTGFMIDRFGARILVGIGLFIWSLAQGAGGLAARYGYLLVSRAVLGVSEAPAYPASTRVIANWFPPQSRGSPTGVYTSAATLAPAIAPPVLTALMLAFGWRMMFIAMGVVGVVFSIVWLLVYRDSSQIELSPEDRRYLHAGEAPPEQRHITLGEWLQLLRSSQVWGLFCGCFCLGYVIWIHGGWMPAFLETQYHMSLAKTGLVASIPWIGAIIGSNFGGYLSDWLCRHGVGLVTSKRVPMAAGLAGLAIFTGFAGFASSPTAAIVLLTAALFCGQIGNSALWTGYTVLAPPVAIASVATISNCGAYLGATFSPMVTGFIVDRTGSFSFALLSGAAVGLVGAVCYATMVTRPVASEPVDDRVVAT